jgi:signal transduction histidine kinase
VLPDKKTGLLSFKSLEKFVFTEYDMAVYESLAQILGLAIADRRARAECHERVKELTCLYGIARIAGEPDLSLEQTWMGIAALLPPAWQYPDVTTGRIIVDGKAYVSPEFTEGVQKQSSEIVVNGNPRGRVEVYYIEQKPILYEGPFLKEERSLIDAVAQEVALIIDRREVAQYKSVLEEQLRHADRLATLGQLAAGVAHELNEPLGAILGFAQLALKCPDLAEQCKADIDKIVKASLHAREVVRKLLLFARQMPAQKTQVDINRLVQEGLFFIESRCTKQGINLVRDLDPSLPSIFADPSLLHQVLVNLVVNAIQAMPQGGKLTIRTRLVGNMAALIVEDTGEGMTDEVKERVFMPFFTTKSVGQGTGLGLSVAHGIVSSHDGRIEVETKLGSGTTFKVLLPIGNGKNKEEGNDSEK